jgi:hypothetical protein
MAKENPQRRWPTTDILTRAVFTDDAGPIRFVDTEAAARYLTLEAHTLECYRALGEGPAFYKFGRYVRYLQIWPLCALRRSGPGCLGGALPQGTDESGEWTIWRLKWGAL